VQTSDPDARLMLAFRDGDAEALATLYGRWSGPLVRFLERLVGERATAEELMQETFVRIHGARDRYTPEARFSTWLFRIGRNLALNELDRARTKAPHLSTDATLPGEPSRPAFTLVSGGSSIEHQVDVRRARTRVEEALATLPERQRAALWLAAVEGRRYDEIAAILETTPSSVKALVHRARARLADGLAATASPSREAGS
jgi:RNA polymerase sigma-70 factor (ECF subfamily)